ncbi:MAG: hypothetical protein K2L93_07990, partial [Muribaculaceae bacterium]|nr:hypothetical protein [Muribaculaceae bacterium]
MNKYLTNRYPEVISLQEERVVKKWQLMYTFTMLPPTVEIGITIPCASICTTEYAIDWNPKFETPIDNWGDISLPAVDFVEFNGNDIATVVLEFAIYDNIDWCQPSIGVPWDIHQFYRNALNYSTYYLLILHVDSI